MIKSRFRAQGPKKQVFTPNQMHFQVDEKERGIETVKAKTSAKPFLQTNLSKKFKSPIHRRPGSQVDCPALPFDNAQSYFTGFSLEIQKARQHCKMYKNRRKNSEFVVKGL